ncbi:TadE/TadG family type IV pilus assembly protein (plasmid) [Methylobacterium phyllosphaerae]
MLRRFTCHASGVTAVEFSLLAPVLIALVMGGVEFGSILYTYAAAEFATNDVARQLATNRISSSQVQPLIVPRLPVWAQATAAASATASNASTPSSNIWTVTTTIPMANATPSTYLRSFYGSRTLHITVSVQQEPTS